MAVVMTLNEKTMNMVVGGCRQLTATILPNTPDAEVTWTSSNESVAVVDNGLVFGVSVGAVVITAVFGELSATCAVTVAENYSLVTLDEAKERLSIDFDDKDEEITNMVSSIVAYVAYATGLQEKQFANLSTSAQNLAKDYVLKSLYYDYYDLHSELNDRRLTAIMKQLQLIGANS